MDGGQWLGSGNEARYLFAPLSTDEFATTYFGKKPLYIRGTPTKFAGLFDRASFQKALFAPRVDGSACAVHITFAKGERVASPPAFGIVPQAVEPLLKAGATVCFANVHLHDEKLRAFASAVRTQLGYPGSIGIHSYWSPDGAGFETHFDARIATTLQIEGAKTWRFSKKPAVSWPAANATYLEGGGARFINVDVSDNLPPEIAEPPVDSIALDDFDEVTLQPGDVLALPAGTWHACKADGHSLALNLHFNVNSFAEIMSRMMLKHYRHQEGWRGVPPLLPSHATLAHGGELRARYASFIKERFAEFQEWIATIGPEDPELLDAWALEVLQLGKESPRSSATSSAPLGPDTPLRIARGKLTYAIPLADGGIILYVGSRQVTVDETSAPFLRRLIEVRTFVAKDALAWTVDATPPRWEAIAEVLSMLEVEGIIERAVD